MPCSPRLNFNITLPSSLNYLCPCLERAATPAETPVAGAPAVTKWLHDYNEVFARFEKISKNGLYSVLEKEVKDITPLLNEGHMLNGSYGRYPMVTQMIHEFVRPRLEKLQNTYTAAQKKILEHPKENKADAKLADKWLKLGLPASVLENHADCVRFLFESSLIYTIIGYRESFGHSNDHDIKLDTDGHPMLKTQGNWIRWERIEREIHYDAKSEKIKSRAYSGSIVQAWSYFHPHGLVPVDRYNYDHAFPVFELSEEQYAKTRQHALKFYETNPEKDMGIPKDSIVQFFTSPRRQLPEKFYFDNANEQYPVHVGMRLITPDRKVYSFGYQLLPEEAAFIFSDMLSNFLATADAKVTMLDYEEFRAHEGRIVTSIPLSSQRSQNILNYLNELNGKQLRFQYERQNCSLLMLEVIKKAGYDVNIRTTGIAFLYDVIPNLNQFPIIGRVVAKVEQCVKWIWNAMPNMITGTLEWTKEVALFVPKKFATVAANLLSWKLGASKKTTPLQEGVEDEELYDKKGLQTFSSVIRSWTDIFKEETTAIYNAKYFMDWQKQQKSTFIDSYTGRPKFSIVPTVA